MEKSKVIVSNFLSSQADSKFEVLEKSLGKLNPHGIASAKQLLLCADLPPEEVELVERMLDRLLDELF